MCKCLLVVQEGKGKSDLWKTFDLVVETTGDPEKGGYRSKHYVCIMCAFRLQYYDFSDHLEQCKQH